MTRNVIALDAMGVLYRQADDVADLLVPYLAAGGCPLDPEMIAGHYEECSLGGCSSAEFWRRCQVDGDDEEYCRGHELVEGMVAQLQRWRADGSGWRA